MAPSGAQDKSQEIQALLEQKFGEFEEDDFKRLACHVHALFSTEPTQSREQTKEKCISDLKNLSKSQLFEFISEKWAKNDIEIKVTSSILDIIIIYMHNIAKIDGEKTDEVIIKAALDSIKSILASDKAEDCYVAILDILNKQGANLNLDDMKKTVNIMIELAGDNIKDFKNIDNDLLLVKLQEKLLESGFNQEKLDNFMNVLQSMFPSVGQNNLI
jgi:hypothetical protein